MTSINNNIKTTNSDRTLKNQNMSLFHPQKTMACMNYASNLK